MTTLMIDLAVVFIALCAGSSVIAAAVHVLGHGLLDRLTLELRARLRLMLLFAPVGTGLLGVTVALVPSVLHVLGLANDHCLSGSAHGHAHLCFVHQPEATSRPLAALVAAMGFGWALRLALTLFRSVRAQRAFDSVIASSRVTALQPGVLEFDSPVPVCMTLGVVHPKVYVSSAAIAALGPECIDAALAHERAHVARHETRVRLAATLAATFHLHGFAESMRGHWQQDSELICDQQAANATGSSALVADALVRFHRAQRQLPVARVETGASLCSEGSRLSVRVENLLSFDAVHGAEPAPGFRRGLILISVALLLLAVEARHVHHALESLVGMLSAATS